MKFKALFITFNIVLFLSFVTIFFLPYFILDSIFMIEFWSKNWFFALIFLVILGIVNGVFLAHWKTLTYLEKEDWPGLSRHLEIIVFDKHRFGKRKVGLLCDALILLGDFRTLGKLESELKEKKPRLFAALSIKFASAFLLAKRYEAVYALAQELGTHKDANTPWLSFYGSFALHLQNEWERAADGFILLCGTSFDPLVTALSGCMCAIIQKKHLNERDEQLRGASRVAKGRVTAKMNASKWHTYIDEEKAAMHVVVLGKLIDETGTWLYG